ncbi:dUTP diphosphatase [Bartonella sp. PS7NMGDW]|uniref:dUTP diphosphatase n=1 Tax=Bartonella sp. PS7NMGDW TaxID=3243574 RepID=UPI0035D0B6CC
MEQGNFFTTQRLVLPVLDLQAAIGEEETLVLAPGQRALIPTGLIFHLSRGLEAQIRPRSSLALKHAITCLNTLGTIECDYPEVKSKFFLSIRAKKTFLFKRRMRIAQTVIAPVFQVKVCAIEPEQNTQSHNESRETGGFGSTGHT